MISIQPFLPPFNKVAKDNVHTHWSMIRSRIIDLTTRHLRKNTCYIASFLRSAYNVMQIIKFIISKYTVFSFVQRTGLVLLLWVIIAMTYNVAGVQVRRHSSDRWKRVKRYNQTSFWKCGHNKCTCITTVTTSSIRNDEFLLLFSGNDAFSETLGSLGSLDSTNENR